MRNKIELLVVCSRSDINSFILDIQNISKEISVKYSADTYKDALCIINDAESTFDAILVDSTFTDENVLSFLKSYSNEMLISRTIIFDNIKLDCYNLSSSKYQIFNVFPKCYKPEELIISLKEIKSKNEIYNLKKVSLYDEIAEVLKKLGIAPDKNGFHYLRKAIYECYFHPEFLTSITKNVYPILSTTFDKKESCIERSIRNAIESGWTHGDFEYSSVLFSNCVDYYKTKPTNGQFIAVVVDKLMIQNGITSY
jgi:hypothetical protein